MGKAKEFEIMVTEGADGRKRVRAEKWPGMRKGPESEWPGKRAGTVSNSNIANIRKCYKQKQHQ